MRQAATVIAVVLLASGCADAAPPPAATVPATSAANLAACETAVKTAVGRAIAAHTQASRPAECEGVSDSDLDAIISRVRDDVLKSGAASILASAFASDSAAPAPAPSTTTAPATVAAADSDNGWTLVGTPALSLTFGMLTAHARIRNDSGKTSAMVQLTYGADTASPVVLSGAANDVAAGKTVTVDLISGDKVITVPAGRPKFRVTASA